MADSSPSDLAVAFRSLGRRFREAVESGDEGAAAEASGAAARLRAIVTEAAGLMDVAAPGDLAAGGDAVAAAIAQVPADAWDDARLSRLRALALEAGSQLREVARIAEG